MFYCIYCMCNCAWSYASIKYQADKVIIQNFNIFATLSWGKFLSKPNCICKNTEKVRLREMKILSFQKKKLTGHIR